MRESDIPPHMWRRLLREADERLKITNMHYAPREAGLLEVRLMWHGIETFHVKRSLLLYGLPCVYCLTIFEPGRWPTYEASYTIVHHQLTMFL
jgi:hypothetical protein